MIDVHIHVVSPQLPGAGSLGPALQLPVDARAALLRDEMRRAGVTSALAMGRLDGEDALGIAETLDIADRVPGLWAIGAMDPRRGSPDHFAAVEQQIKGGRVKALKGYLGYLHFGPDHAGYRAYYELAERYRLPVIFHTGDTYSPRAKLRFAHPLLVDEVAVDHPRVDFVLAHVGNPWTLDAAEVIYKNLNVWADLSGLAIGESLEEQDEVLSAVAKAFRYSERPNRFLFGSDWPLAPLSAYLEWIRRAIPEPHHEQVFRDNANRLFRLED